jgi:hypothetical protein
VFETHNTSLACVEYLSELSTAKVATDVTLIPKVIVQMSRKPTMELAANRSVRCKLLGGVIGRMPPAFTILTGDDAEARRKPARAPRWLTND